MELFFVGLVWIVGLFTFYSPATPTDQLANSEKLTRFTNQIGPEGPKLTRQISKDGRTCLTLEGKKGNLCLTSPKSTRAAPVLINSWKVDGKPGIWRAKYADGLICDIGKQKLTCKFPKS